MFSGLSSLHSRRWAAWALSSSCHCAARFASKPIAEVDEALRECSEIASRDTLSCAAVRLAQNGPGHAGISVENKIDNARSRCVSACGGGPLLFSMRESREDFCCGDFLLCAKSVTPKSVYLRRFLQAPDTVTRAGMSQNLASRSRRRDRGHHGRSRKN